MASPQNTLAAPNPLPEGGIPGENFELRNLSLAQLCQLQHGQIQREQRKDIMLSARDALLRHRRTLSRSGVDALVGLARYLCDWPLLIQLQRGGYWQPKAEDTALAEIQMGWFDLALQKVEPALKAQPFDLRLVTAKQELDRLVTSPSYEFAELKQGPISLTPLNFNHVSDFGWQYCNVSIAQLCNLPVFPTANHWIHWLHVCQQEKERRMFAVMHEEYGFVGSVSLQVFDGLGFFYYWLGTDFQGMGLGPKAVDILMCLGQRYMGMQSCYAKVFQRNKPSHRAIVKLGFERLPLTALAPSEDEVFYYSGAQKSKREHHGQLAWLLEALQSGIYLTPLDQ